MRCAIVFIIIISGCSGANYSSEQNKNALDGSDSYKTQDTALNNEKSINVNQTRDTRAKSLAHITQCNRDLESLRTVNVTEHRTYLAQYEDLMKSSAGFMAVKDDVSPEVADLVRPRFQFALVNLCYRIKNALAQTLINQAGGIR